MLPNSKADGHHQTVVKRVSRKHEDEGHGGAWKVAFADFCLALLCLFLVLWLLASRNAERMQQVLQNAGANLIEEGNGLTNSLASGSRGSMIERFPVPAHGEVPVKGEGRQSSNQEASTDAPMARTRYESPSELQALARLIERVEGRDPGALGAAVMAGVGAGLIPDLSAAARTLVRVDRIFTPRPTESRLADRRYALWRDLYPALRPMNHALHAAI